MAGGSTEVRRVLAILEERGPSLGLHVNIPKCEVFLSWRPKPIPTIDEAVPLAKL